MQIFHLCKKIILVNKPLLCGQNVCVSLRSVVMMMGSSSRLCAAYSFFDLGVSSLIANSKNIFYLKLKFFEKTTRNLLLSFDNTYLVKVGFVIDRSH